MKKSLEEDIILFNLIKKNNQKAFEELFNKYYQVLCDFSYMMTNSEASAEEIVADVFANIWIKRKKITIEKNLQSYLYKSTRNATISYLRKNKSMFETIDEDKHSISISPSFQNINSSKEELKEKANDLLKIIPKRSREIFVLHRFNEFKYRDIAEMLDISIKTVEKHMSKALKLLRENYG